MKDITAVITGVLVNSTEPQPHGSWIVQVREPSNLSHDLICFRPWLATWCHDVAQRGGWPCHLRVRHREIGHTGELLRAERAEQKGSG